MFIWILAFGYHRWIHLFLCIVPIANAIFIALIIVIAPRLDGPTMQKPPSH
jgi:hypothetical protein